MADINLMKRPMSLLKPRSTDRTSPLSYFRMDNEQERFKEVGREFAILGLIEADDVGFRSIYVMSQQHWYMVRAFASLDGAVRITRALGDPTRQNHRVQFKHGVRVVHLDESMARLIGRTWVEEGHLQAYRVPTGSRFVTGVAYTMNAWPDRKLDPTAEDVELNDERGRANEALLRDGVLQNGGMIR